MSAVRFHFGEGEVLQVRGMERAAMDFHTQKIAVGAAGLVSGMGPAWDDREAMQKFGPYLSKDFWAEGAAEKIARGLTSSLRDMGIFSWRGERIGMWSLVLNTALAVGSDPIRLCAKIHATCEIHGFFEGKDRDWFAGLIEEGLEDGVFRKDFENLHGGRWSMGWPELIEQLRKNDTEPVVMSFTVTDGFPDPPEDWRPEVEDEERWNEWADLPYEEQFTLALAEIREDESRKPIGPETLRAYRFGHELSLLDLMRQDYAEIEKKLGITGE